MIKAALIDRNAQRDRRQQISPEIKQTHSYIALTVIYKMSNIFLEYCIGRKTSKNFMEVKKKRKRFLQIEKSIVDDWAAKNKDEATVGARTECALW